MVLNDNDDRWGSKRIFLMVLLCQILSVMNINIIPITALTKGATGYCFILIFFNVFLGIPLLYMESIVGQFTERDCIDIWKIRPCLSHIGYFNFLWQLFTLINNHTVASFVVHYFLITFENPIPFFTCGPWSLKDCNVLVNNFTVNQECIKIHGYFEYCDKLYETFPEYQYWRYHILSANQEGFHIAWRVCLASGIICFITNLICFKRHTSLKYALPFLSVYPFATLIIIIMGSMRQKGIVAKFEYVIDLDFSEFFANFQLSYLVQLVIHNLGVGSGVNFNLTSTSNFRSTCFFNSVVCVIISTVFTIFSTVMLAMMTCPFAFEFSISPKYILEMPISLLFERLPKFLSYYEYGNYYLILIYSCCSVLAINTNAMLFFNLLEMLLKRNSKLAKYPGMTCLCGVILLFLTSIPLLSSAGVSTLAINYRRYMILISTFMALIESLVFVLWYGLHRFSEDVHFMLGIKPRAYMKFSWFFANIILLYTFITELLYQFPQYIETGYAPYVIVAFTAVFLLSILLRLFEGLLRKKIKEILTLDPQWGPKSDLLQRSRGMFSAQAMTKEYMYRQYHLQGGIITRQQNSNKRLYT